MKGCYLPVIFIALAFLCGTRNALCQAPAAKAQEKKAGQTRLDVRLSPTVDLYYLVRKLAADSGTVPNIVGFDRAIEAARDLQSELKSPLAWGILDSAVAECQSMAEVAKAFEQLPETLQLRPSGTAQLRQTAVALAQAMSPIEARFLMTLWPRHKDALEGVAARLAKNFTPKEAECFAYMMKHLGMKDPHDTVPLYLVVEAPAPGGVTHRRRGGGGVCFIGTSDLKGSQLYEVILHEATHALDLATGDDHTVLNELREQLRQAGLSERDREFRDVPHTLMFVQAGETIRRVVDPAHKHYGEVSGYYQKVPLVAQVEVPVWTDYLDGKLSREEAITRIVNGVIRQGKKPSE